MKVVLNIYGSALFLFLTYLLLGENIQVGDTTLYFLNGNSVGLQNFDNLYNLRPMLMNVIYFLVLAAVLVSIKFNKFHLAVSIGNLILSIPIFIVHKNTLFFKPFYFTNGIVSYVNILTWIWYIYLSLLGILFLISYFVIKKYFFKV